MFFLFKQKTAYELRISDWSSDVCSSDLFPRRRARGNRQRRTLSRARGAGIDDRRGDRYQRGKLCPIAGSSRRSEEHTSELQSLMRISYAVFCLKNKSNNKIQRDNHNKLVTTFNNS